MSGTMPSLAETNQTRILQAVRELFQGRSNAVGVVTLTASATATVITAPNIGRGSKPVLFPATANAAAALATTYVSLVNAGTFTLAHANNAQTDRNFHWVALG